MVIRILKRIASPRRLLAMLALLPLLLTAPGPLAAAAPELRVLIDVSGSMRRNDPDNLRVPALRLIAQFLPAGASAGIWLFAENTEALESPGQVDDAWRARVRARLERIHARGLFTDIEKAVAAATDGWDTPEAAGERHLLLLTDGLVDIAAGAAAGAASRERLLAEWIPRLQAAKVKIHAVGLSDEVDGELLERLTARTGGWLEAVRDADKLQRIFLHMLEQTAPPTTVPLKDNGFEIDASITEFTVLAFRDADGKTALIAPDGLRLAADSHPDAVGWRHEPGYDLITIATPPPGSWRIEGVADPDNRVVVVTDLGLDVSPTPNTLGSGETLRVEAWATDHGRPLTRLNFLELLKATASLKGTEGNQAAATTDPPELTLDRERARYLGNLETPELPPGVYQFEVLLDGETLQRQVRRRIRIAGAPLTLAWEPRLPAPPAESAALAVTLGIDRERLDPTTLSGYLRMQAPNEAPVLFELPRIAQPTDEPPPMLIPVAKPGTYQVSAHLTARALDGSLIAPNPPPEQVTLEFEPPAPAAAAAEDGFWSKTALYVGAGNLILLPLLGVTWLLLRPLRTPSAGASAPKTKAKTKAATGAAGKGKRA